MTQTLIFDDEAPKARKLVFDDVQGDASGAGTAFMQNLNPIPFNRKLTSAIGAGVANAFGDEPASMDNFKALYNQAEANALATDEASPYAAMAGNLAGIIPTAALGSAASLGAVPTTGLRGAVNAIPQGLAKIGNFTRSGNLAVRAGKGAAMAAPVAALYGAGEAKTGEELRGAGYGAGMGAVAGAALPLAGAALVGGIGKISSVVSQKTAKRAFEQMAQDGVGLTDIPDKALGKVLVRLQSDFPDEQSFMQALETYAKGDKALIESAGDRTINLAKGAAQYPSGEAISKEFIQGKLQNTPERIKTSLSNAVSDKVDYYKTAESISKAGQAKAAPLYQQAFDGAPVISERVNQFVNTPELQAGINRGLKIQRLEALRDNVTFDPKQYGITQFNEAGDPIISGVPNMRLLDAGKRGLDAMIEENTDQFGKLNEMGRALVGVKQSYLSELDNINPAYKEARKAAGDYLSNVSAMRQGKDFSKMDSATIKNVFDKMDAGQQESFKAGVVKSIRDKIDNAPDSANIYKQVFGRPEQRNRLQNILGEKEFNKLSSDLASEQKLYRLRDEVLGGSPTASKQVAASEFNDEMIDLASSAARFGATKALIDKGTSLVLRTFSGLSNKTASEVAKALYETDPTKKLQIMEKLRFMAKKQEVKPAFDAYFSVAKASKGGAASKSPLIVEITPKDKR